MATQKVQYKKPRRINVVSVTLIILGLVAGYLVYQYLPIFLKKQEALRVLDEVASEFSGSRERFIKDQKSMEKLHREMKNELRLIGIDDPYYETWIEVGDDDHVKFGVAYVEKVEWPFEVIKATEETVQVEYDLDLNAPRSF